MKFSIRDLLLVTVIVALAVGWWLDRSHLAADKKDSESDARYLSKLASNPEDPFIDVKSKELSRKYGPVIDPLTPIPNRGG